MGDRDSSDWFRGFRSQRLEVTGLQGIFDNVRIIKALPHDSNMVFIRQPTIGVIPLHHHQYMCACVCCAYYSQQVPGSALIKIGVDDHYENWTACAMTVRDVDSHMPYHIKYHTPVVIVVVAKCIIYLANRPSYSSSSSIPSMIPVAASAKSFKNPLSTTIPPTYTYQG